MSPQDITTKQPEGTKLVLVAIGLALFAVLLTFIWIEHIKNQVNLKTMTVYVLSGDRRRGSKVEEKDFTEVRVPEAQFATAFDAMGAITPETKKLHIDKQWERDGAQGQLITKDLFESPKKGGFVPAPAKDSLSYPIRVNDLNCPGTLGVNDYVQVRAPFKDRQGQVTSVAVIDKVQVVALGTAYASGDAGSPSAHPTSYRSVTIDVNKDDVADLDRIIRLADGEIELLRVNPAEPWSDRITKEARDAVKWKLEKFAPPEAGEP
jgi:hypothetical protein